MKLIVCVDKNNGLSFNQRRLSRDRVVTENIATQYAPVHIRKASAALFSAFPESVVVGEELPAETDDACFAETLPLPQAPQELIVYRWDRDYPADVHLPFDLRQWKLHSTQQLTGYSHLLITKEIYTK